jgi:hypothetical protein
MRVEDDELFNIAKQEFKLLESLDDENVIKMEDIYYNALHKRIYLTMEYQEGTNL